MQARRLGTLVLAAAMLQGTLQGQQQPAPPAGAATSLTALDYYEIQQVYARVNHGLDTAEDAGGAFARAFTDDGLLVTPDGTRHQGRDVLAAFARQDPDGRKGPTNVGHYTTNVALDVTPAGVVGRGTLLEATLLPPAAGARGPARAITEASSFVDALVRTNEGWRIATRTLARAGAAAPPVAAPTTRPPAAAARPSMASPLSAQDYADITQIFALFGYAFDSAADAGYQWADLYTPDGVFVAGSVVATMRGRETLAAFAAGRLAFPNGFVTLTPGPGTPHNPLAIAHILTDLLITPTPDGAVAKAYRLNARIGDDGRATLAPGGVYHVLLARTSGGWRFKENWYIGPGGAVQDGAKRFLATVVKDGAPTTGATPATGAAPGSGRDRMPALTLDAEDDAAIRQLYARFSHAVASGAGDTPLSHLFTSDGVLVDTWTGASHRGPAALDGLAGAARAGQEGQGAVRDTEFVWTVKLEATPQGAFGKAYMMTGTPQTPGTPVVMTNGGQYWDDLVKTSEGWRFRKRVFQRSSQVPPPDTRQGR
ncbi:MAG: nuclear transport factor 2 family protein [Vicinamibacterales bacterium]